MIITTIPAEFVSKMYTSSEKAENSCLPNNPISSIPSEAYVATLDDNEESSTEVANVEELSEILSAGGNVTLGADLALEDSIMVTNGGKIDLNGKNVAVTNDTSVAIKIAANAGSVVIEGDGVVAGATGVGANAVQVNAGSTLTINGGTFTVGADENGAGNATIYAKGGEIVITGGEYSSDAMYAGRYWTLNCQDKSGGSITCTGGKFLNFNPASPKTEFGNPSFVAEGYKVKSYYADGDKAGEIISEDDQNQYNEETAATLGNVWYEVYK